jgi:hypothetical protein
MSGRKATYTAKDGTQYAVEGSRVRHIPDGSTPDPSIVADVLKRVRAIRAKRNRQARESAMLDVGMVRGTDSMGRRIWE